MGMYFSTTHIFKHFYPFVWRGLLRKFLSGIFRHPPPAPNETTVQTLFKYLQWCLQHTASVQTETVPGVTMLFILKTETKLFTKRLLCVRCPILWGLVFLQITPMPSPRQQIESSRLREGGDGCCMTWESRFQTDVHGSAVYRVPTFIPKGHLVDHRSFSCNYSPFVPLQQTSQCFYDVRC